MLSEDSLSTSGNERTKNTMDGPVKHEAKKSKVKKKTIGDLKEYDNKREQLKVKQNPSTGVNSNKKSGNNLLMSGDDNTSNKFKYDRLNKTPYIVFVRKLGERNISKSISVIVASRLLTKANIKFKVIEPHAWNTWKIIFDSYQEANASISNKFFSELGLLLYIPKYKILRKGVIKGIPMDISLDEIRINLVQDNQKVQFENIFRLKRKDQSFQKMDRFSINMHRI